MPEQLARGLGQSDVELALQLGGGYMFDCEKREEEELGLDRDARRQIQSCLNTQGFDPGAPDGLFGPRTRGAISAWQEAQGDGGEASGYLTQAQRDDLLASCKSAAPTPLCTGQTDTPCWMEVADKPGCYVWTRFPSPEKTVTWSGACVAGKASGKGEVVWRYRRDEQPVTARGEGELREGKLHGHWVEHYSSGAVGEGPYLDGKPHGHWVWHQSDGDAWEGPYVNGELHGRWVRRGTKGEQWNCWSRHERVEPDHPLCATESAVDSMRATKGIALRSGPGDDYEQIGRLHSDDRGTVKREGTGWAWVETDSGQQGFVPLSALEEVKEPVVTTVVTEPKCALEYALEYGSQCWVELTNRPNCYFFFDGVLVGLIADIAPLADLRHRKIREVSWSGECVRSVATGEGIMTLNSHKETYEYGGWSQIEVYWQGALLNGHWQGACEIDVSQTRFHENNARVMKGNLKFSILDDLLHGQISSTAEGYYEEEHGSVQGSFYQGKRHGEWREVYTDPHGNSYENTTNYGR